MAYITDIEGIGFQGYEHFNISLKGPGLNVVTGPSDTGKSSVVRLIEWVAQNNRRGDGFKNENLSPKDSVIGSICFDNDEWVSREKGKDVNNYTISTQDGPLKALKTDVPQEVKDILKLESVNIQSQHPKDQYFMLTESPGQVAKMFNEVAGLSVMDEAISEINSSIRGIKQKIGFIKEDIEQKEQKITALSWTEEARKDMDILLGKESLINKDLDFADSLENAVVSLKEHLKKMLPLKYLDEAMEYFHTLSEKEKALLELKRKCDQLEVLINSFKLIKNRLSNTELLEKAENDFSAILERSNAIENEKKESFSLDIMLSHYRANDELLNTVVIPEIKDLEEEWHSYSGEACPICGGTL